ncbi:MAG: 2-succinyl-5-enolpyruvyl-6-hydroxy-3-cyclohexene-1-carboxylic-acid synthase [Cyanobacteria bacterium J06641_5]
MLLDDRNTNLLWSSILVETCRRAGVKAAAICPGSRSGPLAIAFARCHAAGELEAISVLDERSAAFLALGIAKQTQQPVAVVCSSGTAGANFFPAVIEAHHSRVPLLVLSADRPPELRDCHAGQAIDQGKLFGNYANWYAELALPEAHLNLLCYLRQTVLQAVERSHLPVPGPVHLNIPFRDPLAPVPQESSADVLRLASALVQDEAFFAHIAPPAIPRRQVTVPWAHWRACERGAIVAGVAAPTEPDAYCLAVARLAAHLGWPVLADALSPLRNWADCNPNLVSSYDLALRNAELAEELAPDCVLQLGPLPTSKVLRAWLARAQPERWTLDPAVESFDPLHGPVQHLPVAIADLVADLPGIATAPAEYLQTWLEAESQLQEVLASQLAKSRLTTQLLEAEIPWLLGQILPVKTPLMVANSMPVRDLESFWPPGNGHHLIYCNRGANGIDGTLSTALGIAWGNRAVLLTGDLALLHDTNGFLNARRLQGHLTIVLVNNHGGGIFGMLPIAEYDPPFEEFFATPQEVDFAKLCAAYDITYERAIDGQHLKTLLHTLPATGVRLLEIVCDRQANVRWRQQQLPRFADVLAVATELGADEEIHD